MQIIMILTVIEVIVGDSIYSNDGHSDNCYINHNDYSHLRWNHRWTESLYALHTE